MTARSSEPRLHAAGLAAIAAAYVGLVLLVHYHADDGFIALRYVQNLLAGHGLNYNPGERVEGYNCFLWLALVGGVGALLPSVSLVAIVEVIGVASGVFAIVLTARLAQRHLGLTGGWALLPAVFVAAHSGFVTWSTGGLETTFFTALILLAACTYLDWLATGRRMWLTPLLFGIGSLTRPDAVPVFLAVSLHALVVSWRQTSPRETMVRALRWSLIYLALTVPYYLLRYDYYGWPLPNTAYAKVGSGIAQYRRGVQYILDYAQEYGLVLWILPALWLLAVRRDRARDFVALLLAAHLGFVVLVGGDGLAFDRFLVYSAPLSLLLVAAGYQYLAGLLAARPAVARSVTALLAIVTAGGVAQKAVLPKLAPASRQWTEPHAELTFPITGGPRPYTWFDNYFIDRQALAARYIDSVAPGALVAATPAGAIAYYGNLRVIDMLGLNDVHIAHVAVASMGSGRAGHEKGDGAYVLRRRPDAILLGNVAVLPFALDSARMARKLVHSSERQIWADPAFHRDYELVSIPLESSGPFRYLTFARRRDGAIPRPVAATPDEGSTQ